ncbi:glycosyltransferase [Neptunomonas antarctica]|uniref:Glycosyltransferase involved in cell wall bisynthesis n=1 Tax=Neptunomonas antarctica TaxID=619304 RepID=A0A1N7JE96_9GAMM|nr:glycosyltransferase [Neptunomonas antarctica]SIS47693.1 Glycosyltransferase involved in cell wall bisynthesis [Neptunomonas antarctica]
MANILVIAGEYPPLKTIGRIRSAKLVQHWKEAGHTPVVLTINYEKTYSTYEESLEAEIPDDIHVYRVDNPQQEDALINIAKKILRKNNRPNTVSTSSAEETPVQEKNIIKSGSLEGLTHLYKNFYRNWVAIPDDYSIWAKNAFPIALEIIEKHNIDLIYVSLPPFSALGLGAKLKDSTNLPLIVDYRDLWSGDVLREWVPKIRVKYESFLEKSYLKKADAIITVSSPKTDYIRDLVNNKIPCHTITNGFDLDSFDELLSEFNSIEIKSNKELNIVYCGRLFKNRKGYNFIESLGLIKNKSPELVKPIRVNFYGDIEPIIFKNYKNIIEKYNLYENFIFHGDVSFEASKKALVTSDFLLLIVDTGETTDGVIPGKLFEYIASKKPIFALSDSAATNGIINEANIGKVVPVENLEICVSELELFIKNYTNYNERNEKFINTFDRRLLSYQFIDIFNKLLK